MLTDMFSVNVVKRSILLVGIGLFACGAPEDMPNGAGGVDNIIAPLLTAVDHCNNDVCMTVVGTKLYVDSWTIRATGHACGQALFRNKTTGKQLHASAYGCSTNPRSTWTVNKSFPDGTELCSQWTGISGYPCIYVHK